MSVVIDIDHNAGNLSEYTATSGKVTADASAAMAGTAYGMLVTIDDTTIDYGAVDITANTSGKVRARFYIDPNSMTLATTHSFVVFRFYNTAWNYPVEIVLKYLTSTFQIIGSYTTDGPTYEYITANITDAPHYVEFYVTRATSDVATDGTFQMWVDGTSVGSDTTIDNYDTFAQFTHLRFGDVFSIDSGDTGLLFLDELVINDDGSEIGPVSVTPLAIAITPDSVSAPGVRIY